MSTPVQQQATRQLRLHREGSYEVDVIWRDGSPSRYIANGMTPQELAESLERVVAEIRAYDRQPNQSER